MVHYLVKSLILFTLIFFVYSPVNAQQTEDIDYTQYVDPFIGTGGHGHTFPGATMPFGMIQVSPDTRLTGWDGCSGYHYSDNYIYGFSHTHLSGTGVSDYGDILLMPTDRVIFQNGADGSGGYRAHFSHENEDASPGYYKVYLDSTDITVELTCSYRSAIHKYRYPSAENQVVILDLEHRDKLLDYKIKIIDKHTITGYRFSDAWANNQKVFYYIHFSQAVKTYYFSNPDEQKLPSSSPTKLAVQFHNPENKPLIVKVGISAVDIAGAKANMLAEIGELTFAEAKKQAKEAWNSELHKIEIKTSDKAEKVKFYTAMYHTMIAPNIYQDVDGRYRGMDLKVHQADFTYYTVFSLWDTYRATHPLFTIIDQARTTDFIRTFLAKYKEGGIIPIWDLSACYTGCMIGYHSIPVIADAYMKGIRDYDTELALEAMVHSATQEHLGLKSYMQYGVIPIEDEGESVSKTLEYAYDDWCIAQMAQEMGESDIYKEFIRRAQYYKNEFDPKTGFMRGRIHNRWFTPFDPYEVNFNFTEANSWQYSFYVPQDISGLIDLYGGKKNFERRLDALFNANTETTGRHQVDMTGLIGQYVQGNEPSHQIAYMYNFVNAPYKTQKYVHQICSELYKTGPGGIPGNEDCGQMSAWYIFSTLGFYPVTPGNNQYIIGTPRFAEAEIYLENGNTFTVKAKNLSDNNFYIQSARLNGKPYPYSYITHDVIMEGGTLTFFMTDKPSEWATSDTSTPVTSIDKHMIVPLPFIAGGKLVFQDSTRIVLNTIDDKSSIYYKLGDSSFRKYDGPFTIHHSTELTIYGKRGLKKSAAFTTIFSEMNPNISLKLETQYARQYNAGGKNALIDGFYGSTDYRTGTWQGYDDTDLIATITLDTPKIIDRVSIGFLQYQKSWIFLPKEVLVSISTDGKTFHQIDKKLFTDIKKKSSNKIVNVGFPIDQKIKAVRIHAVKAGHLPSWHPGYPYDGKTWIFADEITVYEGK